MPRFRVWLLRVHGALLLLLGLGNAVLATVGWQTGAGMMGFLSDHRLGHVGLLQAYLLAAVLGGVLLYGSRRTDPRPFNRIGAFVHLAILPAYALHWDYFPEVAPAGAALRGGVVLHLLLLTLEAVAGWSRERVPEGLHRRGRATSPPPDAAGSEA